MLKEVLKEHISKNHKIRRGFSFIYYLLNRNKRKISGRGNKIECSEAFLKKTIISVSGNNNVIKIGKESKISNLNISILGDNNTLVIGESCIFFSGAIWFTQSTNGKITIEDKTTVAEANIGVTEENSNIVIGEDCMIAHGVDIRTGDSHPIIDVNTGERINPVKDIIINAHVWIGAHVRILKGVEIGQGTIIGMGAIVSKSVPEKVSCAGVPAKILRENVTWERG